MRISLTCLAGIIIRPRRGKMAGTETVRGLPCRSLCVTPKDRVMILSAQRRHATGRIKLSGFGWHSTKAAGTETVRGLLSA
jgi:hypothetical protein